MRHSKRAVTTVAGAVAGIAIVMAGAGTPALASEETEALKHQLEILTQRIQELEAKQAETEVAVKDTADRAILGGGTPGTFILPGTGTEFQIGGYVKGDLIYDLDESTGDAFSPEGISTAGNDEARFRAHARQSRLFVKTSTPSEYGPITTLFEGDFFGGGGNEVFSNSASFRLRHAVAGFGGFDVGQYWTNFMPIESYPSTVDFNGPAGIPFIRQAQIRYTTQLSDNLKLSGSLENSEFNGRFVDVNDIDGDGNVAEVLTFAESLNLGVRAGVDTLPDATLALTYVNDYGLIKLAGVGRLLSSPTSGDEAFGWGVNLSGNAKLWQGGKALGSFTFGDGVGRYILNGFAQDAFVDAAGNIDTIAAYGLTLGVTQALTDTLSAGLSYGRYETFDQFRAGDLEAVNTVHASLFWRPVDRVTFGGEVIYGDREDVSGASDDAVRLQTSVQINF